jgi:Flp pilus assembly protein TadG
MNRAVFRNFLHDRRANVAMMFGLLVVPMIFIVGMGIDYGTAARLKSKMNAAADAAVLAAVTPAMMTQSDAASTTAAQNMFNAQVAGLPRLIYNSTTGLTITVTDVGVQRNVTVAYSAQSQNLFGGFLGSNTIAFGGSATGTAATPPNIDFYLLLDSSPSMGIAGTPADIATMVANTSAQSGCAFACHEANPAGENPPLGNPGGEDNYALARSLGVTLRADLLDSAITSLTNQAYNEENNSSLAVKPVYRMSISFFDVAFNNAVPLTGSFVSAWSTELSSIQTNNTQTLLVYDNNNACQSTTTTTGSWPHQTTTTNPCGAGTPNSDADTNYDAAMQGITNLMPTPGDGKPGDQPQEILFFVTDGVEDENVNGSRQESTMTGTKDWCTPLKNKGIKIAVLYTEYFPLPTNSWYNSHVASYQPSIGTTLQNCASSGLYYEVGMGQDITAALAELFQNAVNSAHLTQ